MIISILPEPEDLWNPHMATREHRIDFRNFLVRAQIVSSALNVACPKEAASDAADTIEDRWHVIDRVSHFFFDTVSRLTFG
jgi:hypothetical protein